MAGRREEPLSSEISPAQRLLAQRLRGLRKPTGLTYSELSNETGYSPASLSRIMSGARLPKIELLSDLLDALGAGPDDRRELLDLWSYAHREQRGHEATASDAEAHAADELRDALDDLRVGAGQPSIRRIADEAHLSPTTVHRVLQAPEQRPDQVLQVALTLAQLLPPEVIDRNGGLIKVQEALNRVRRESATEQSRTADQEIDRGVGDSMPEDGMLLVELPDGTPVWARVSGGQELAAQPGMYYTDTGYSEGFSVRVDNLEPLVTGVARSLAGAVRAAQPDEVSIEFGIELASKAGRVVGLLAGGETKSAITVRLTWQGSPPTADGGSVG
ncbi:CU044_2847 family protein [Streptomyces chartreusis]|uniref:Helix-turn-helix domain-containing protein n=1 Tax=Streptomyces chartreusis TaxID=1969 RepID=A0A7H8TF38_STRCX|nr:CU044_2847 family protein [Streptomyces chartreusis]QKZ22014.1 helix-turn-helix domain-containing protein [Streptomyces chartreusis]